jgi:hypothetical protein
MAVRKEVSFDASPGLTGMSQPSATFSAEAQNVSNTLLKHTFELIVSTLSRQRPDRRRYSNMLQVHSQYESPVLVAMLGRAQMPQALQLGASQ